MKPENDVDLADAILAELTPVLRAHLRDRLPALLRASRAKGPRRVYTPVTAEDKALAEGGVARGVTAGPGRASGAGGVVAAPGPRCERSTHGGTTMRMEYSLDNTPVTKGMRERAAAVGVDARDDAAVRAHHARVSRAIAEMRQREDV